MDEAMVYREIGYGIQEDYVWYAGSAPMLHCWCTYAAPFVPGCCTFSGTIIRKSLQMAFLVGK